jgi:CheY-like chemotaxis protein
MFLSENSLPLIASTGLHTATRVPSDSEKQGFDTHDYCILVVDDCRINQKITMRTLTRLGYPAHVVADGQQALEALTHYPYALVLMDCQMPVMDGYQAAREIRRREAPRQHLPIIAYSTSVSSEEQTQCFTAGMDAFVEKPCTGEYLEAVLQHWLEISKAGVG